MYREEETSFYDLLEISPEAGPTEIYEAYQKARETYSPHSPAIYSMFTEEEARDLLKLIDEAYSTLSNRSRKRAYDLQLGLLQDKSSVGLMAESGPYGNDNITPYVPKKEIVEEKKVGRPEEGWTGVVRVHKKSEEIPPGHGRTRFGLYAIDDSFERDIENVEECDGSFLQKIREYKSVKVADLSEAMKTSKSTLKYLEENDLARLPVQVFTRGLVVQYCRMLMLNEDKIVSAYMTYFKSQKNS